jgi:polysaccharide deacetylase family protein (PEP-CTERM system associated)
MRNVLSVDVEEYFYPTEVQRFVDCGRWEEYPSRIEAQVDRVLELFERRGAKATFFVLGWVAEHHARLLSAIRSAGHEVACHSYAHRLVYGMNPAEFRRDTERAMTAIKNACGVAPAAYRAPSYSITRESLWALEVLAACGFTHDSSIYPIAHDRYGIPGFDRHAHIVLTPSGAIEEVPIATASVWPGLVTPIGGGAYLRLLPYRYTAAGIRRINGEERKPACIYFHPWELDPDLPRLCRGRVSRLRTYAGIESMPAKLDRLLGEFQFASLGEVHPCPPTPPATVAQPAATPAV